MLDNGFINTEGKRHAVTFIKGDHGAAVKPENHDALARFVLGDNSASPNPKSIEQRRCRWVVEASKFCWLIWLVLVTAVLLPIILPVLFWNVARPRWLPAVIWPPLVYVLLRTI